MIDLNYYSSLMDEDKKQFIVKHYGNKKFKTLKKAEWFFKEIACQNASEKLQKLLKLFASKLAEEQMSFEDKKTLVLDKCDKDSAVFSFLEVKGTRSVTCVCPKCKGISGKYKKPERAWIPDKGNTKAVVCNHRSTCGFSGDFIAVYAEEYKISYGQALNALANELGIDFTVNEVHIGQREKTAAYVKFKPKEKKKIEIKYIFFDKTRKVLEINVKEYLKKYNDMNEEQQFKMIATAIYRYSKTTKQWGKEKYFTNIGIFKNPLLKEKMEMIQENLGYLFKTDLPELVSFLLKYFPKEDLVKFGVIIPETYENGKSNKRAGQFKWETEEGLVVIPNFDLYSNMCTGLKYRKTKLKSWINKQKELVIDRNKEPEFSYGRIVNPIPYHLTRDALMNKETIFRLFEGQKDLHSIPYKEGTCDIAIPGVNGIGVELLGLFKGRKVEVWFDQDKEGQKGAIRLIKLLNKAGAYVLNKTWDSELGSDVNEVLQNGNIEKII